MTVHHSLSPMLHTSLSIYHNFVTNAWLWLLASILFRLARLPLHRADLGETVVDGWRR
jgi:hypothetical protein